MTASKRRNERADRNRILEAARGIAQREDWPAVTIRKIADELGYTSPLIYEHFENKQEVLTEVMREGFRDLAVALGQAPKGSGEPEARLLGLAATYWGFARAQPEVYKIMHGMGGIAVESGETAKGAQNVCEIALDAVQDWAQARGCRLNDPLEATEILWATLHGITCLGLADRLGHEDERPLRLAQQALISLLNAWRHTQDSR